MGRERTLEEDDVTTLEDEKSRASVISFFSGCGGLDLGFEGGFQYRDQRYTRHAFRILKAYDIDQYCKATYEKNLKPPFELLDLSRADVKRMPAADVLIGGFPCQEFSICGPLGGTKSARGMLFKAMSRYARHWRPKIVVAENVSHLTRLNEGADLKGILRSFANAGYRGIVWRLYAPDYGVPQARNRVILVFVRSDIKGSPQPPKKIHLINGPTVEWAIADLLEICDESVPNQSQYFRAAVAKRGHGQGDEISPRDSPGYTVRANAKSRVQFHYELPRRLTVRECARLQTFPDNFVFPFAATRSVHQIGNAVPPVMAHAVASSIADFLKICG
ncbi:DNA (cytosine-5-)-methyltransferase [Variovorax sp. dw_954]|uniref:DNA cytosine methyltransferase n=1 Tax=Variovorax sp. dw_954 TaxID=2720078 RepID=UPI001BD6DA04|nr:DNA (cytosine-5-)-methyltransferase [Variovorax sp. dw_954]